MSGKKQIPVTTNLVAHIVLTEGWFVSDVMRLQVSKPSMRVYLWSLKDVYIKHKGTIQDEMNTLFISEV